MLALQQYCDEGRTRSNSFSTERQAIAEGRSQIRYKLLKLLRKRSSKDFLEKKGIIKNEPIFGNTLVNLYDKYQTPVPEFLRQAIEIIEMPESISSLGLYR